MYKPLLRTALDRSKDNFKNQYFPTGCQNKFKRNTQNKKEKFKTNRNEFSKNVFYVQTSSLQSVQHLYRQLKKSGLSSWL